MSNTVKYFHSDLTGAPVLNGTAGAMIALLDACLVNGWGTGTVDSVVISGGIATVTRGAGHPFEPDMVAEISGATVSGGSINGQKKVLTVAGNTYTFDATGIANQTATGTITHKIAPLGFTKAFNSTNLAAYRSSDATGTQFYLRVDDSGTTNARVVGYETMTAISTGDRAFPTEAQLSGGMFWPKSNAADSSVRQWSLYGNGKTFYLCVRWSSGAGSVGVVGSFGDLIKTGSTDAYAAYIHGPSSSITGSTPGGSTVEMDYTSNGSADVRAARSYTGVGSPVTMSRNYPVFVNSTSGYRSGETAPANHIPFPNASDGGVYVAPWFAAEGATGVLRGRYPGFYAFPQKIGATTFTQREKISAITGLTGRKVMVQNSSTGAYCFDVTGPWE